MSQRIVLIGYATLFTLVLLPLTVQGAAKVALPAQGKVTQVLGGTSIRIDSGLRVDLQSVSILPGKEAEATEFLNQAIYLKEVWVQYEPGEPDRFGRVSAFIYLNNGKECVNRMLIDEGFAEMTKEPERHRHRVAMGLVEEPKRNDDDDVYDEVIRQRLNVQYAVYMVGLFAALGVALLFRHLRR